MRARIVTPTRCHTRDDDIAYDIAYDIALLTTGRCIRRHFTKKRMR